MPAGRTSKKSVNKTLPKNRMSATQMELAMLLNESIEEALLKALCKKIDDPQLSNAAIKNMIESQFKHFFIIRAKTYDLDLKEVEVNYIKKQLSLGLSNEAAQNKLTGVYKALFRSLLLNKNPPTNDLKRDLNNLKRMDDDTFTKLCNIQDITDLASIKALFKFKNQIVESYERYFEIKNNDTAQTNITQEEVSALWNKVIQGGEEDSESFLDTYISELMLQYVAHPHLQSELFLVILDEAQATAFSLNNFYGCKKPRDLKELAQHLPQYYASVPPVAISAGNPSDDLSEENFEEVPPAKTKNETLHTVSSQQTEIINITLHHTQQVFIQAESFLQAFNACSGRPDYTKNGKRDAINITFELLSKKITLDELNALYNFAKPYLNRHRHATYDALFELKNTQTWQTVMKRIRDKAYSALETEINNTNELSEKIQKLQIAREMPLFAEHRHNYKITGAFGRTGTLIKIDKLIEKYQDELAGIRQTPKTFCCII